MYWKAGGSKRMKKYVTKNRIIFILASICWLTASAINRTLGEGLVTEALVLVAVSSRL